MLMNNILSIQDGCHFGLILLCQIMLKLVIPAGKRVSSAMDGKLNTSCSLDSGTNLSETDLH
jgi:hypothetical protein